jgi:YVTN family beta-propeller protein
MILKTRVFSLALLLALAAMTPGVLKAQDAQPMSEVSLGTTSTGGGKTAGGNLSGGTVTGIDGGGDFSAPAASTTGPEAVTYDGTYVWIASQFSDSVTRVRVSDGTLAGTFAVGKRPVALLYAAGYVWVANLVSDTISKVNPSTGAVAATYSAGDGPGGLTFDGTSLWISNREGNNVIKMSTSGAKLGTFAVGHRPVGIAFASGAIWVVNNFSNSVSKLSLAGALLGTFPTVKVPSALRARATVFGSQTTSARALPNCERLMVSTSASSKSVTALRESCLTAITFGSSTTATAH